MNLQLSLKLEWFDMTNPNGKTEDYRDITLYWIKRLLNGTKTGVTIGYLTQDAMLTNLVKDYGGFKPFSTNIMTLGYPSKTDRSRFKIHEHAGIEIGYGKPEWGAPTDKVVFIIKHGKEII